MVGGVEVVIINGGGKAGCVVGAGGVGMSVQGYRFCIPEYTLIYSLYLISLLTIGYEALRFTRISSYVIRT